MAETKVKVVFVGRDAITDSMFNIVKIGVYTETVDDCVKALRDGILDKYGREAPEFSPVFFEKIEETVVDKKKHSVYVFACKEYDVDNVSVATLISGKVTYSRIL